MRRSGNEDRACLGNICLRIGAILRAGSPVLALQGDNACGQRSRLAIVELQCGGQLLPDRDLLTLRREGIGKTHGSRLGRLAVEPILRDAGARLSPVRGDGL